MSLLLAAALVCATNVPFGYWRGGLVKLSPAWFVAIHAPVPLVFLVREVFSLDWRLATVPVFVSAYFLGQWLGGRLHRRLAASAPPAP